jgi:hypothetical protein
MSAEWVRLLPTYPARLKMFFWPLYVRYYFVDRRGERFYRWIWVFRWGKWPGIFERQIVNNKSLYDRRNSYPWGSGCINRTKISPKEMGDIVQTGAEDACSNF